ncbi:hypothetical protein PAMA_006361 [Pampus argenteus]
MSSKAHRVYWLHACSSVVTKLLKQKRRFSASEAGLMVLLYIIITALMVTSAAQELVVSQMCLSSGKREVSCNATGHKLEFIWRLNNKSLATNPADNRSPPADPVNNQSVRSFSAVITLESYQSGDLTCEVKNEVSGNKTSVNLIDCEAFSFHITCIVIIVVLLFVIALLVCLILLLKEPTNRDNNGDVGEVVYADVKIQMGKKKRENKSAETVEYGQIRVHRSFDGSSNE